MTAAAGPRPCLAHPWPVWPRPHPRPLPWPSWPCPFPQSFQAPTYYCGPFSGSAHTSPCHQLPPSLAPPTLALAPAPPFPAQRLPNLTRPTRSYPCLPTLWGNLLAPPSSGPTSPGQPWISKWGRGRSELVPGAEIKLRVWLWPSSGARFMDRDTGQRYEWTSGLGQQPNISLQG